MALDHLHLSHQITKALPPRLERLNLPDGYVTAMMVHEPLQRRRLPVLMLHGIQSHPGWFVGSADAMAGAGHAVYQLQRRGSGSNARDRGHARSAGQLLADLDAAMHQVLKASGASRLHLVGISWGGKWAACHAIDPRRAGQLADLTLVAPGIAPRVDVSGGAKLGIAVSGLLSPKKTYPIPLNDPAMFTDNPEMRDYISVDAHRLKRASARFFLASHKMDKMLAAANDGAINLPTNLFLARGDKIIRNGPTREALARLAGERLNVVEISAAHTIEFEDDPEPFFARLIEAVAAND